MALQNISAIGIDQQYAEDKLLDKWNVNPPKKKLCPAAVNFSLESRMEMFSDVKVILKK